MPSETCRQALKRGVRIHLPDTVFLDIPPEQIAPDVEIFPGCRLTGDHTWIGPGCRLGEEAPATLHQCCLGSQVLFKGGFAEGAVFLDRVTIGSGAHIRPGTLLEEQASIAHSVGLKQTLLMPYVTLGSLINFCDCLMAGGTSRSNHSEVGSSFVHFNFTPHQDKATASLIGDVPHGVMLDQNPIFLGGQGGLVGPIRIVYGTVLAAGSIARRDILNSGQLVIDSTAGTRKERAYTLDHHGNLDRVCRNNILYLGNLHAIAAWYDHVRSRLMPEDAYTQACLKAARQQIADMAIERLKQLGKLADQCKPTRRTDSSHAKLIDRRAVWEESLVINRAAGPPPPEDLIRELPTHAKRPYLDIIPSLSPDAKRAGSEWLQGIVNKALELWET